jgi:hypothetical protein
MRPCLKQITTKKWVQIINVESSVQCLAQMGAQLEWAVVNLSIFVQLLTINVQYTAYQIIYNPSYCNARHWFFSCHRPEGKLNGLVPGCTLTGLGSLKAVGLDGFCSFSLDQCLSGNVSFMSYDRRAREKAI